MDINTNYKVVRVEYYITDTILDERSHMMTKRNEWLSIFYDPYERSKNHN